MNIQKIDQIPIEFLNYSKNAGALIISGLLRANKTTEALQLVYTLGSQILPQNEEDWDAAKGSVMKILLEMDRPEILSFLTKDIIEQEQNAGTALLFRNLLIFSAKARAAKCFDWTLENGKTRKSKKIMEVAFFEGSSLIAARVKRPTPLEANELWGALSHPYINRRKIEFADFKWILDHLPIFAPTLDADQIKKKEHFINHFSNWSSGICISQFANKDFPQHYNQLYDYLIDSLKIPLTDEKATILCSRLAAVGAAKACEHVIKKHFIDADGFNNFLIKRNPKIQAIAKNPGALNSEILTLQVFTKSEDNKTAERLYWSTNSSHYIKGVEFPIEPIAPMTCAIVSQSKETVDVLKKLGFKIPAYDDLFNSNSFTRINNLKFKQRIESFYESMVLEEELKAKPLVHKKSKLTL